MYTHIRRKAWKCLNSLFILNFPGFFSCTFSYKQVYFLYKKPQVYDRSCSSLPIPECPDTTQLLPISAGNGSVGPRIRSFHLMSEQNLEAVCPMLLEVNWDSWEWATIWSHWPSAQLLVFTLAPCWDRSPALNFSQKSCSPNSAESCQPRRQTVRGVPPPLPSQPPQTLDCPLSPGRPPKTAAQITAQITVNSPPGLGH